MLFELVYNSKAVPPEQPQEQLDLILLGACKRNLEKKITGVLVYHHGEFMQLLEGEEEAVMEVYDDFIVPDRRHIDVHLDWTVPIDERAFADWSMGFACTPQLTAAGTPGLAGYLARGAAGLDLSGPESDGRVLLTGLYATLQHRGT